MYKRFFDTAGDPRLVSSGCGKMLDVNQAGVELLGYCCKQDLLDLENVCMLFCEAEVGREFQRRLQSEGFLKEFEADLRKRDGVFLTRPLRRRFPLKRTVRSPGRAF